MAQFAYKADGEVVAEFLRDDSFFRGLRGPVGSGKSVACCVEIFRRALAQPPGPDGIKRSRWAVVRNTNPQLRTTTIKTWLDWFPEEIYGQFNWSPPFTHHIRKGPLDLEVIFLALDKPEDVKKLLSLELTGVWINEAREVSKSIVDGCTMRVGRYPSKRDGGPAWYGVICDTNSPDEDHWWPIMAGEVPLPDYFTKDETLLLVKPKDWRFFRQPGAMVEVKDKDGKLTGYAMNDNRENRAGIDDKYYRRMIEGKARSWIKVYVCNQYGALTDGKPVYPHFDRELHVARDTIAYIPNVLVHVGLDFGLTPAAVFAQQIRGQWRVLRELVCTDMGTKRFSVALRQELATFPTAAKFKISGDPTGDSRSGTDEETPYRILRGDGVGAYPAGSNDPVLRIGAVEAPLQRLIDGSPGLLIDPGCVNLIKGFEGGYHYRRLPVSGAEKYEDFPNKNRFSHPHDALQYLLMSGGEGKLLLGQNRVAAPFNARRKHDVFARPRKNAVAGRL